MAPEVSPTATPASRKGARFGGALALSLLVWGLGTACDQSDVGRCCTVLAGRDSSIIPKAEQDDQGKWKNVAATNPAFDCDELTCVSYEGAKAYCSKECISDGSCPEGYSCQQVIKSMSGPNEGPKSYCVKAPVAPATDASAFMCTP